MFESLRVFRHRLFENNFGLTIDLKCNHVGKSLGRRSPKLKALVERPLDDDGSDREHQEIHIKPGEWREGLHYQDERRVVRDERCILLFPRRRAVQINP